MNVEVNIRFSFFINLCFIFSIILALDQKPASSFDIPKVQLKPPTNVTIFFINSSFIAIGWDAPSVYHLQFNETIDVDDNSTVDSSESTYAGNTTNRDVPDTVSGTINGSAVPSIQCLSFETLNKSSDKEDDGAASVSQMDEAFANTAAANGSNTVSFFQGCVQNYKVKWWASEKLQGNFEVPAWVTSANITGLKANTSYQISIAAIFVENYELVSSIVNVSTSTTECHCDNYGTIAPSRTCSLNKTYCSCKPGYSGQFCQICAYGFYRSNHYYPCHRCPCLPPSSPYPSCSIVEGFLKCDKCQLGYSGNLCHQCDVGFYKYGKKCIPCLCNGNSLNNVTDMCHPITGSCNHCQYNTTGFQCERCLDGYRGDPFKAKNCTSIKDLKNAQSSIVASSSSVLWVIGLVALLILLVVLAVLVYIKLRNKAKRWDFWIVKMKRDDDVDSMHNNGASVNDEPDLSFYGTKSKSSYKYAKLHEEL